MSNKNKPSARAVSTLSSDEQQLVSDIRNLIDSARQRTAAAINAELSQLYLQVGERINRDILGHKRAHYGQQVLANLAGELTQHYGRGWSLSLLRYCLKAAETYSDSDIRHTVCVEFS